MKRLKTNMRSVRQQFLKSSKPEKVVYLILSVLLIIFLLTRTWRIDQLLSFYFDQGRDALVINSILNGKLVLIGPTTGIAGLFLGPFYYYLLLPGYFLGGGSPVIASYWQSLIILMGYLITIWIALRYFSKMAAIFTLLLMVFSFFQMEDDRWLSNPTPTLMLSPLTVLLLVQALNKPLPFLPVATFCLGLMLQLEASSSFLLLILTAFWIIFSLKVYKVKPVLYSLVSFLVTLLPQILFDLRHNFLLSRNLIGFIRGYGNGDTHSTFQIPSMEVLRERISFFADTFIGRLDLSHNQLFPLLFILLIATLSFMAWKNWSRPVIKVMSVWFFGLLILLLFYQGNFGRVYSYYLLPLMPVFFLFLGLTLASIWKKLAAKILVVGLLGLFVFNQLPLMVNYLSSGVDGVTTVALGNQSQAVKYVLQDAAGSQFNVDVYVPPVIPYTYTYLFEYSGKKFHNTPLGLRVPTLYTIHEVDTESPKREHAWLGRQDGIGRILKSVRFGGIGVEKRNRL